MAENTKKILEELEELRKSREALEEKASQLKREISQAKLNQDINQSGKELEKLALEAGKQHQQQQQQQQQQQPPLMALITKKILQPGDGEKYPAVDDTVYFHFTQTCNGEVQMRPYDEPVEIVMGKAELEPPYESCLMSMSKGEKAQFSFNSLMLYGPEGNKSDVPPKATIGLEVEVVNIAYMM